MKCQYLFYASEIFRGLFFLRFSRKSEKIVQVDGDEKPHQKRIYGNDVAPGVGLTSIGRPRGR